MDAFQEIETLIRSKYPIVWVTTWEERRVERGMAELAQWYATGKIKPAIDLRLPMRELPAAYARMATRKVQGKVLMVNA